MEEVESPADPADPDAPVESRGRAVRRAVLRALLTLVVLALLDAAWVGYRGLKAKSALESARSGVVAAHAAESAGDYDRALALARSVKAKAAEARRYTNDAVWHFDAHLPLIGKPFTSAAVVSHSVDDVVAKVLPVFDSGFADLRGGRVRDDKGRVDVDLIGRTATSLVAADDAVRTAQKRVGTAPASTGVGTLDRARRDLLSQLTGLAKDLDGFSAAARLAPDMLGAHGPRRYFLAEVNTAEARGAGGLLGTFGIITADRGKLTLAQAGTDDDLKDFERPPGTVGGDFSRIWDPFFAETVWRDAGSSPDFPSDAAVWLNMWKARTGERLDGVLLLDPGAVGALVAATHPITVPDGTTLTGPNDLTTYVESTLYAKYGDGRNGERRAQLVALQKQLFDALTGGGDATALLRTVGAMAGQRRLLLMSAHPEEQSLLAGQPIGGALPTARTPYLQVTIQNQIGNKIDYYTQRTVRWSAAACRPPGQARETTVDVTLRNTAPAQGLSAYVGNTTLPEVFGHRPRGSNHSWVSVYGSIGAVPVGATLDGKTVPVTTEVEKGHPLVSLYVDAVPGQESHLVVQWRDPTRGRPEPVVLPPTALAPSVTVDVASCPP